MISCCLLHQDEVDDIMLLDEMGDQSPALAKDEKVMKRLF